MQPAEFDAVFITVTHRPPSGPFGTTEFRAGSYKFETTSAGFVRIFSLTNGEADANRFIQFGPGQWWATGRATEKNTEAKKR